MIGFAMGWACGALTIFAIWYLSRVARGGERRFFSDLTRARYFG